MDWRDTVFAETMRRNGFLERLRTNAIDEAGYARLLAAIQQGTQTWRAVSLVDRLVVACLFALPFEVESAAPHYRARSDSDGHRVAQMSGELTTAINELLWSGLEAYCQPSLLEEEGEETTVPAFPWATVPQPG